MDLHDVYDRIDGLVRECGTILTSADRSAIGIDVKEGHANFVTTYDRLVQDRLQKGLLEILPEAGFFGEEGEKTGFPDNELVFIVDPIDGTTNFIKDLKLSCIAVSLTRNLERIFGLVYNPFTDEMFRAVKGEGATLNGAPIHASGQSLERSIAIFGTSPYNESLSDIAFARAKEYLKKCIDVRRLGSAELDLCYVACGRAELYFEPEMQPWDFAAGSLIAEEAGARVVRWDGSALDVREAGSCLAHGPGISIPSM